MRIIARKMVVRDLTDRTRRITGIQEAEEIIVATRRMEDSRIVIRLPVMETRNQDIMETEAVLWIVGKADIAETAANNRTERIMDLVEVILHMIKIRMRMLSRYEEQRL